MNKIYLNGKETEVKKDLSVKDILVRSSNIGSTIIAKKIGEEKYKKVLPLAIKNILTGKPVELWGNGSDLRSFIFINDVVETIMNALTFSKNNVNINVSSGNAVSILELLQILKSVSSKSMTIINRDSSHIKRDLIFDMNETLEEEIISIQMSDSFVESYAREKLDLVKPDEVLIEIDVTKDNPNE